MISRTVMVMVLNDTPSATTLVGAATTLEVPADTAPAVKVIVAVCVMVTLLATAVMIALPDTNDLTVAINCPEAFVVPEAGVKVSVAPRLDDKVTLAPFTKLLFASRTVTVIVLIAAPLATTLVGAATTVESAGEMAPETKLTVAVCVIVTLLATAVITALPIVLERTVPVI